nr:hypothetical protein HK105_005783 [Polyrhizophydium stewartii]
MHASTKVRSLYADQVTPLVDGNLGKTLVAIESDHLFVCAPLRSARRLASTTPQTKTGKPSQPAAAVYSYFWETPWTGTLDDPVGRLCGEDACHTTDLIMLFRAPADDHGAKITAAFRRYVANFLATADPNTAADAATLASVPAAQTLPTWPQFGASSPQAVPAMRFARSSSRAVASEPVVTLERVHPNAARCELMDTIPYEYEPAIAADGQDTVSISRRWIVLLWTVLGCFIAMQVVLLLFAKLFFKRIQMLMDIVALVRGRPTSVGNEQAQWPMLSSPSKVDLGNMQAEAADFTHSASRYDDPANKEALLSEVLDFQPSPVAVDCNRLKYVVGSGASSKTILEDVTFSCKPGSLTALIGPSGAGKTSLMSLSTDAQQCISYQGRQLSHMRTSEFQRLVGFVPQHNPPYTGLTPLEVLTAYAKLELAPRTTVGQIAHRVSYILDALGLLPCANVVIQDAAEHKGGISGGQLRRIPIGVALLKQPSVLILDEPTSGLDSRASLEVMQILAELAKKGYTIIVSIHQPRREIFELFTDVILLAQGRLLFNGSPKECVGFTREVKRVVTLSTATLGGRTSLASIPSWPSPPASPFSEAATTAGKASEQEQAQQDAGIELLNPADAILDVVGGIPKSDVPEIARFGRRWRTLSATYSVKTESSHESIPQAADQQPETRTRPSQITLRAPETTASGLGETPASMSMASPEGKSLGPISLLSRSIDTVRIPVEGSPPTMLRIPPRLAAPPLPTRASMVQAPASVSGNSSIVVVVQPSAPHSDSSESANAAHAGDEHATREISDEDAPDEPQVSDALLDGPSAYTFPTDGHQPMTLSDHPSAVIGKSGSEAVFTHPNSHLSMDLSDGNQQADSNTPQGRSGTLGQMIVANARWWRRRPLIRKLFMPIVSIAATLLLGFMQRRTESDMTGIVLQIKGLAIASVGLGALKNINISFDYYEDRDLYDFDSSNGAVGPFAFFIHRLIYETATSTVESTAAGALAIAILGSQASPSRIATILALIVTYYNCLVSFITLIYSTRLSRPEARSVSFFSLVMIALTSGLWIKRGDTALYSVMAWIETINPTYWLLTPMLRANVAGVGACLIQAGPFAECRAWEGDLILEEARVDRVPADVCLGALIIIWAVLRGMQLVLLVRDANAPKLAAWFCRSIKRSA